MTIRGTALMRAQLRPSLKPLRHYCSMVPKKVSCNLYYCSMVPKKFSWRKSFFICHLVGLIYYFNINRVTRVRIICSKIFFLCDLGNRKFDFLFFVDFKESMNFMYMQKTKFPKKNFLANSSSLKKIPKFLLKTC